MMNSNWHEYDFSMEFLLPHCNKPFNFCSKDTFILINFSSNRVASVMFVFIYLFLRLLL